MERQALDIWCEKFSLLLLLLLLLTAVATAVAKLVADATVFFRRYFNVFWTAMDRPSLLPGRRPVSREVCAARRFDKRAMA